MNTTKALGFLVASAVNTLLQNDDEELGNGCCIVHCGPCAALKWFMDNDSEFVNNLVISLADAANYSWQNEDGSMKWEVLQERWDSWPGCSSSNGVFTPCVEEEEEEAPPYVHSPSLSVIGTTGHDKIVYLNR